MFVPLRVETQVGGTFCICYVSKIEFRTTCDTATFLWTWRSRHVRREMGGGILRSMEIRKRSKDGGRKINRTGNRWSWRRRLDPLGSGRPMHIHWYVPPQMVWVRFWDVLLRFRMGVTVSTRTYINPFFSSSSNEKATLQTLSFDVIKPNLPLQIRKRHSSRSETGFDLRTQVWKGVQKITFSTEVGSCFKEVRGTHQSKFWGVSPTPRRAKYWPDWIWSLTVGFGWSDKTGQDNLFNYNIVHFEKEW